MLWFSIHMGQGETIETSAELVGPWVRDGAMKMLDQTAIGFK